MKPPLLLSSSQIHTFMQCRKAYDLTYLRQLEPLISNENVEKGTAFHLHAAMFAQFLATKDSAGWKQWVADHANDEMLAVFQAYRTNKKWTIAADKIILPALKPEFSQEHPIYIPLVKTGGYDVWLRCTFDLIYKDLTDWFVFRDWKTFSKEPTMSNSELDFQGRLYTAVGMRHFEDTRVRFEWEHVRNVTPGSPRGTTTPGSTEFVQRDGVWYRHYLKGGKMEEVETWNVDQCYFTDHLVTSKSEADELWIETQNVARDLVRCMKEQRWYRSPRRGNMPFTCGSCFARHLCKTELATGPLDEGTIASLANPRSPITVPPEDLRRWKRRIPKVPVAA